MEPVLGVVQYGMDRAARETQHCIAQSPSDRLEENRIPVVGRGDGRVFGAISSQNAASIHASNRSGIVKRFATPWINARFTVPIARVNSSSYPNQTRFSQGALKSDASGYPKNGIP